MVRATSRLRDGALLTLSEAGGTAGERALPLVDDGNWDALTDRVSELLRELETRALAGFSFVWDRYSGPVATASTSEKEHTRANHAGFR